MKNRIKLTMLSIALVFSFLACGSDPITSRCDPNIPGVRIYQGGQSDNIQVVNDPSCG